MGFVAGDDPRMLGTIGAVEEDLMRDGLLLRYRTESGVDGLAGDEHPFLACSFWLVSAYAAAGRRDDAEALMRPARAGSANDVGLLAEEYDPRAGRMARQLPPGVQPPRAGARGVRPALRRGPAPAPTARDSGGRRRGWKSLGQRPRLTTRTLTVVAAGAVVWLPR